jgi:hypothetical protein
MSTLSNIPSVGYYGFTQITVTSLGYSGPVSLTSDPSINGPVVFALLKPTSTSLSSGGSASSTLDVWAGGPYVSLTQQVHVYATTSEGTIQLALTVSFSMSGNTGASYVTPDSFGGGGGANQS